MRALGDVAISGERAHQHVGLALGVKQMADHPNAEVLYYVGCAGSFDDRAKKVATAIVNLLKKANVDFAILGKENEQIQKIDDTKLLHAYKWILEKYYGIVINADEEVPYSFFNKKTGLLTHYLIKPDKRFLNVNYIGTDPLPKLKSPLILAFALTTKLLVTTLPTLKPLPPL